VAGGAFFVRKEGFFGGLNRHVVAVSGWIFTVGGAVASLWVGQEYFWITGLCLLVGLGALTVFAYEQWQLRLKAEVDHKANETQFELDLRTARDRAGQAEQKLNAIPADVLLELRATIQRYSLQDLAAFLGDYADYVARMKEFVNVVTRPIALRTFVKRAGELYVDAKLTAQAIGHLRQDDPFLLEFKSTAGLVTASAEIRVHQTDAGKELVWFRIAQRRGDELEQIDALAEKQEVAGKGYTTRPVCDVARYASVNMANAVPALQALIEEAMRLRG
jgi:hypothetical protein